MSRNLKYKSINERKKVGGLDTSQVSEKDSLDDYAGKIEEVPFNSVLAYIQKYHGIGRFADESDLPIAKDIKEAGKMKKQSDFTNYRKLMNNPMAGRKIKYDHNLGRLIMLDENNKVTHIEKPMAVRFNGRPTHDMDVDMKEGGRSDPVENRSEPPYDPVAKDGFIPASWHRGPLGGRVVAPKRKGGAIFGDDSGSDIESDYESLDYESSDSEDDFTTLAAAKLKTSNNISNDALLNAGTARIGSSNFEMMLIERAKATFVNPKATELFMNRLSQFDYAQQTTAQEIVDGQPGTFIMPNDFEELLMRCDDNYLGDVTMFTDTFQTAIYTAKNFEGFLSGCIYALERNDSFEGPMVVTFSNAFANYLSEFMSTSCVDYCVMLTAKYFSQYNNVASIKKFLQILSYYLDQKNNLIQRHIEFQGQTGFRFDYNDVMIEQILDTFDHLDDKLDAYAKILSTHGQSLTRVGNFLTSPEFKGLNMNEARIAIGKEKMSTYISKSTVPGQQGQIISNSPSDYQKQAIQVDYEIRNLSKIDLTLSTAKSILIAEINRAIEIFKIADFVNITPLLDLKNYLQASNNLAIESETSGDITQPISSSDVFVSYAQAPAINLEPMKKCIMAQGFINAQKLNQDRAKQILYDIMIRIGSDPLAPRIITEQMSEILASFGYYVEQNTGISQAYDQLKVKMEFTFKLQDDLTDIIGRLNVDGNNSQANLLLDQILRNFGAVQSANGLSNSEIEEYKTLICPSCQCLYAVEKARVPITLPCGDILCLTCACSNQTCYICNTPCNGAVPASPAQYNPRIHAPMNYVAAVKANCENISEYMVQYLLNSSSGVVSKNQVPVVSHLHQIASALYMCSSTANANKYEKIDAFFKDILVVTSEPQLLKTICNLLTKCELDIVTKLVQKALLISELYFGTPNLNFLLVNVIGALVMASQAPSQPLLIQALITGDVNLIQQYCSADNIAQMYKIFQSREVFIFGKHLFNYAEGTAAILQMISSFILCLEDPVFDDVLPNPVRHMVLEQLQLLNIEIRDYAEKDNLSGLEDHLAQTLKVLYDNIVIYLRPIATMSETARDKVQYLINLLENDLLDEIKKKIPAEVRANVDAFLIDTVYVNEMMQTQIGNIDSMFDYGVGSMQEALAKEADFNSVVQVNSEVALGREKLIYPGIQFDLPTNNSAYKGLPPYITAVNGGCIGADKSTPLFNYMMSDGAMLDNPYNIIQTPALELCHTEGNYFYTGYDGFMEEYPPQALDPKVVDAHGAIQPINEFGLFRTAQDEQSVDFYNPSQPKSNTEKLLNQLVERQKKDSEQARKFQEENKKFAADLTNTIFSQDFVQSFLKDLPGGNTTAFLAKSGVKKILESYYAGPATAKQLPGSIPSIGPTTQIRPPSGKGRAGGSRFSAMRDNLVNLAKHRTDPIQLVKPVLSKLKMHAMKKHQQDANDDKVVAGMDDVVEDDSSMEGCGMCGGRHNLHVMKAPPHELMCEHCKKGGMTPSRRIINERNHESLIMHDPKSSHSTPRTRELSDKYMKYLRGKNLHGMPAKETMKESGVAQNEMRAGNHQWHNLRESAKPFFKTHPDHVIDTFSRHKMREPLNPYNVSHHIKNAALIGGKLMSMLKVEKDNHHPEHLENLRHNFYKHIAALPKTGSGGPMTYPFHNFEDAAEDLKNNSSKYKGFANLILNK